MNELKEIIEKSQFEFDMLNKEIENLNNDATRLLELHKKDKEKIDKAIEYIRHTDFVDKGYINFMYELENILRGEEI